MNLGIHLTSKCFGDHCPKSRYKNGPLFLGLLIFFLSIIQAPQIEAQKKISSPQKRNPVGVHYITTKPGESLIVSDAKTTSKFNADHKIQSPITNINEIKTNDTGIWVINYQARKVFVSFQNQLQATLVLRGIDTPNSKFKTQTIWVSGNIKSVYNDRWVTTPTLDSLVVVDFSSQKFSYNGRARVVSITNSVIDTVSFDQASIYNSIKFKDGAIQYFSTRDLQISDTLEFNSVDLARYRGKIELQPFDLVALPRTLVLANEDLNKFAIPFNRIDVIISKNQDYEQAILLYQQLLKALNDAGLSEKYEMHDKEFQELRLLHNHHWFLNWLSKRWWDYGYDKGKIFPISGMFFMGFFICNIIFFKQVRKVYFPESFLIKRSLPKHRMQTDNKFLTIVYQVPGTFLYTAYIFWGLKLELKEMKLGSWIGIIVILLQYIFGVVCLAYLANYVISK